MKVTINGEEKKLDGKERITVEELLNQTGKNESGIAVAVNDEVIPRSKWSARQLESDDRIEIIQAVQGG